MLAALFISGEACDIADWHFSVGAIPRESEMASEDGVIGRQLVDSWRFLVLRFEALELAVDLSEHEVAISSRDLQAPGLYGLDRIDAVPTRSNADATAETYRSFANEPDIGLPLAPTHFSVMLLTQFPS
jgi:hypothetical protein